MYPEVAAGQRGRRLGRRGRLGVVEERRGAEDGGDDGEEAERHRQRHPGHRQIQRQLRAVEHHAQRHHPPALLPTLSPLPASRRPALACGGGSSRPRLRAVSMLAGQYKGGWAGRGGWKRSGE
nr:unnamed protein product [Digitaria exilis]